MNGWKKYGALALAAVVGVGACANGGTLYQLRAVNAEETEEEQRITLNIVKDTDDETESEASRETEDPVQNTVEDAQTPSETIAEASETSADRATLNRGGSSNEAAGGETESAERETEALDEEGVTVEADSESQESSDETESPAEDADDGEVALGSASSIGTVESGSGSIVTTDVSEVVENCMPSIVSVSAYSSEQIDSALSSYYDEEAAETEDSSVASGIIIAQNDEELLIVTSYHTVSDAEAVYVAFSVDAQEEADLSVSAKVKSSSSGYDLAVLAVDIADIEESVLEQLKVANLGSSEDLKVGQAAILISNANGSGASATVGVVSALARTVTVTGVTVDALLADAAVSTGSSGGALVNASGEVIGICLSDDSSEGVGYALPIDTAIPILEQLINKETREKLSDSERGYIGATVVTVSDEAVSTYGMPAGAFVYEVTEGSAAEEAGIQSGDIISALEGESVSSSDELVEKMCYYAPGETITLEVQTAVDVTYVAREVEVTLQAGSSSSSTNSSEETEDEATAPDESDASENEISPLPFGDEEGSDDSGDDDESGSGSGFWDYFDDGFEDGFEDYNSQFR
ncbi:MAG: trypsin-like peptidase domain-containing protein [Lachnospiraceae bacterium]|nr:trypsin-like peptidase domain-containing protein [Lachnospiraceae bacterium]